MSAFPSSPRLLKGGIAVLDSYNGSVQPILPLQCSSLKITGVGSESGDHIEALLLAGPSAETIEVEAEIDAMKGRNP